ncbi:hypothetical protein T484DRAFT_1778760 [Baffinella frigidus]|nr:hypothetical protein T484DRAFT_1778760 [Cryptophyta sp. CCMP2293]
MTHSDFDAALPAFQKAAMTKGMTHSDFDAALPAFQKAVALQPSFGRAIEAGFQPSFGRAIEAVPRH